MKKIILAIFIVLTSFTLASCGPKEPNNDLPDLDRTTREYNLRKLPNGNIKVKNYSIIRIEITGKRNVNEVLSFSMISIGGEVEFQDSELPSSSQRYFTGAMITPNGDRTLNTRYVNANAFGGLQIATNEVGIGFAEIDVENEIDMDFIADLSHIGNATIKIILIK